jgi:hypothetical protein
MAVVKAHAAAEHLLRDYEFGQSEQDRHNCFERSRMRSRTLTASAFLPAFA